jgi:hypothetical protein
MVLRKLPGNTPAKSGVKRLPAFTTLQLYDIKILTPLQPLIYLQIQKSDLKIDELKIKKVNRILRIAEVFKIKFLLDQN